MKLDQSECLKGDGQGAWDKPGGSGNQKAGEENVPEAIDRYSLVLLKG